MAKRWPWSGASSARRKGGVPAEAVLAAPAPVVGPGAVPADAAASAAGPASRLRRTWPQRFLVVGGVALSASSFYAASALHDTQQTVANIERVSVSPGTLDAQPVKGEARNILIAGTTENDGVSGDDPLLAGRSNVDLSDTIMLVRLDPILAQATVVSINRDTWVKFPKGGSGKINEAVARGGMEYLVRTVRENFDIPINDFVQVNFFGFRKLIDEIGGVPVWLPYKSRDLGSFFDGEAGCNILRGDQALNYVRSRKFQQFINGRWVDDNKNDYGRTERQRDFVILAMDRAFAKGARSPSTMKHLIDVALEKDPQSGLTPVRLDTELTPQVLLDIGKAFSNFDPDALRRLSLPTEGAGVEGASALRVKTDEAQPIFDIFRGKNGLQPYDVTFRMVDARQAVPDLRAIDADLLGRGFKVDGPVSRDKGAVAVTTIRYTPELKDGALLLARHLLEFPVLEQVPGQGGLTLLAADDWAGLRFAPLSDDELAVALAAPPKTVPATTTTRPSTSAGVGRGTSTSANTSTTTTTTTTTTAPSANRPLTPSTTTTTIGVFGRPPDGQTCS